MAPELRCLVLADFTADNFVGLLRHDLEAPKVAAEAAPFGQVAQTLMAGAQACWQPRPDVAIVWTQPQAVIESFRRMLDGELIAPEAVLADVEAYAAQLLQAKDLARCFLIPTWVLPGASRVSRLLQMRHGVGIANILMRMNLQLAESLAGVPHYYVLDAQPWLEAAGRRAANPKLWYMAKVAFGPEVFQEAVRDVKAALTGIHGGARKLIVLDLDDTLWGGLVGEIGWQHLALGGHDPAGEAFRDFQRALKAQAARGILLGIVSKNDEAVALQAMASHPEMLLRPEQFAGWRINWNDKAQNIADLAAQLNLGLQSVVFIDDSPAERSRVRHALPEVLVPEWPTDPMLYRQTLLALRCFESPTISQEDAQRTRLYAMERQRSELRQRVGSVDAWLETLEQVVTVEPLHEGNLPRAAQLLNKTNQMNLGTRRMTEAELLAWARSPGHAVWTIHVEDRLGASGLTGLISLESAPPVGRIVDFVLSCRVMGRKVEEAMLAVAIRHAQALGLSRVRAEYRPTAKNSPCAEFFRRSGLNLNGDAQTFEWDARRAYPAPPQVTLRMSSDAEQVALPGRAQ